MMELLSPAGDRDALIAAVQNGADAVYLGAKSLNARMGAGNFDEDALRSAADYLHERGRRLYVTVNTLIKQSELGELDLLAGQLSRAGADAAIVSDPGAAHSLKSMLPNLPLHASTQMAVHNRFGVRAAAQLGMSRVVLARELKFSEIADCAAQGVEIEAFAHGALCTACSGQCLFSSLVGGRSGNRGMCAQPCRLPYRLEGAVRAEGYLLSTRDLMALGDIAALRDAGVTSLKIEGRLKRPEYVAVTTAAYRRALDRLEAGETGLDERDVKELKQMFNRGGFTRGYGPGLVDAELIGAKRPNHEGVAVGVALSAGRVKISDALEPDDALALRGEGREDVPIRVAMGSAGDIISLPQARAGDTLVRLTSEAQLRTARESYAGERALVHLSAHLLARPGEMAQFSVSDGEDCASVYSEPLERTEKRAADLVRIREQILKTGGTPYAIVELQMDVSPDAHLPVKLINDLRRRALQDLTARRIARRRGCDAVARSLNAESLDFGVPRAHKKLRVQSGRPELLRAAQGAGCDELVFEPDDITPEGLRRASDQLAGVRFALALPQVATGDTLYALNSWAHSMAAQICATLLTNIAHFWLSWPGESQADFGLNLANRPALHAAWEQGVRLYVPSLELTAAEINQLDETGAARELVVYGAMPLMFLRHCPIRAQLGGPHAGCEYCDRAQSGRRLADHHLVDRMGVAFPLKRFKALDGCTVVVQNSARLMLLRHANRLPAADSWRLILGDETPDEAVAIVRLHRAALGGAEVTAAPEWRVFDGQNTTTGHYFRGVS